MALSAAVLNQHRFHEGREILLSMLAEVDRNPNTDAVVCNNLAWANLHLEDSALHRDARTLSARAYCMMPWEGVVASTFGCVEALHGDAVTALSARQSADMPSRDSERASRLAGLAAAHARLRQLHESAAALAESAALDPACPLLQVVRAHLAQQTPVASIETPVSRRKPA